MRLFCLFCCILWVSKELHAQPAKSRNNQFTPEILCAELTASIRQRPQSLVMRLEEALVINETSAGDIVSAAIDAVDANPAQVRKIVETALNVAPARSAAIHAAVKNYSAPVLMAKPVEEIRRPELPEAAPLLSALAAGEEVRRAQLPLMTQEMPIVEIRRAEVLMPTRAEQTMPDVSSLCRVPKAKLLKKKGR